MRRVLHCFYCGVQTKRWVIKYCNGTARRRNACVRCIVSINNCTDVKVTDNKFTDYKSPRLKNL